MRRPYCKLNLDERRILATMLQAKATKTKIAETLGRDQSTIHREIKRNWWHDDEVPQADGYWHVTAHPMYSAIWLLVIAQPLLLHNWIGGFLVIPAFSALHVLRIPREEAMMTERFGDTYLAYKKILVACFRGSFE